jgi:phage tail tape-measure protein
VIRKSTLLSFALIFFVAALIGCSTPLTTREKGAGIGALGGAAAGGIIGSAVGHAGAGAAIGGLLGLGAGALIGDQLQGHEMREDEQQSRTNEQQREINRQQREIDKLRAGEY